MKKPNRITREEALARIESRRATRLTCAHLGPELRRMECDSCSGRVELKVFACAVHGEATIAKKTEGIACCGTCKDYTASQPHETPPPAGE